MLAGVCGWSVVECTRRSRECLFGVEDQVQANGKRRMEVLKVCLVSRESASASCTALCAGVFRVVRVFQGAT
jgi:hypothetical protein